MNKSTAVRTVFMHGKPLTLAYGLGQARLILPSQT